MADTRLWHPFADMGAVRGAELVIERGEDVWVWDADGRRYLDATASLWYANVGHGRREIAEAVAAQMATLEAYSVFGDFANRPALELAEALAERAPMDARVFLTSGGGDSVDTAAKIARRFFHERGMPERTIMLSRGSGYHGTHGFGTALGGIAANREGFGPLDGAEQVDRDGPASLEDAIQRLGAERVAAFFVEPVVGAGGVHPPVPGYLEAVADICRRHGVLLVVDAVIGGFGRLGTWFGIERWGVRPDMIAFAKGVTSGYLPLGGLLVAAEIAEPFWAAPGAPVLRHGPTYSGHPACCAAALANIALLERDGLLERGRTMEGPLLRALEPLAAHPAVGEVRGGVGTMAAVELAGDVVAADPAAVYRASAVARERGVFLRPLGASLALSPPLTATEEHFGLIADAIAAGVDAVAASHAGAA